MVRIREKIALVLALSIVLVVNLGSKQVSAYTESYTGWCMDSMDSMDSNGNIMDSTGITCTNTGYGKVGFESDTFGQAGVFNGSNYFVIPNAADYNNMSNFTISAWIKPSQISSRGNTIISKVTPGRDFVFMVGPDKKLNFHIHDGSTYNHAYGTSEIAANEWTNVVVVYSNKTVMLYKNGNLESTTNFTVDPQWEGSVMAIGSLGGISGYGIIGKIDEVRIWKSAFEAKEIRAAYDNALIGISGLNSWANEDETVESSYGNYETACTGYLPYKSDPNESFNYYNAQPVEGLSLFPDSPSVTRTVERTEKVSVTNGYEIAASISNEKSFSATIIKDVLTFSNKLTISANGKFYESKTTETTTKFSDTRPYSFDPEMKAQGYNSMQVYTGIVNKPYRAYYTIYKVHSVYHRHWFLGSRHKQGYWRDFIIGNFEKDTYRPEVRLFAIYERIDGGLKSGSSKIVILE